MAESTPTELPSWLDDNDDEQTLTFNQSTKKVEPVTTPGATNSSGNTLSLAPTEEEKKKQWVFLGIQDMHHRDVLSHVSDCADESEPGGQHLVLWQDHDCALHDLVHQCVARV
mmetsp:Transcript_35133/g.65548  ORF Transcript_35133/g.65548 Transcript_35133/m.65548 type:complete len:113 (+) Transcript_35133:21-359(+)